MPAGGGRARRLQFVIVVLVAALGIADLIVGTGKVSFGPVGLLAILSNRLDVAIIGGLLLVSALSALIWPRWRLLQAKFFLVGAIGVLMLATAEAAARMAGYVPAPSHPSRTYWVIDPEIGFTCRENCTFRYLSTNGWVTGTTDASGRRPILTCRDDPDAASVICLGDSTTFSGEVEDDKTWPEAAARYLQSRGKPCRMHNCGVYGYSGLQSLMTLRRVLHSPGNYRAVVYHYCFNDSVENFSETLPCPILEPDGHSFAIRPPSEQMLAALSAKRFSRETALETAFRTWRFKTNDDAFRSGGEIMYPHIVAYNSRFIGEKLLRDGTRFVIAAMKAECDRHGLPLFVSSVCYPFFDAAGPAQSEIASLLHPADIEGDARIYNQSYDCLKQLVTELGAEFIDIRGCLNDLSFRQYLVSPVDWHFSGMANEQIGTEIARTLESRVK